MRRSHFTRMSLLLPWAWAVEPAPVPPGAVIRGLDIACWEDLPVWRGRRSFLLLSAAAGCHRLRLDAALSADAWRGAIQTALRPSSEAFLVEVAGAGSQMIEATYVKRGGRIELEGLKEPAEGGAP